MLALTFQIGQEQVAVDVRRISEVVPRVPLARAAGSPPWLAGTLVYRQHIVPVVDLHVLLGAGECPARLSSRIIVVPWQYSTDRPGWLGLLAASVSEIRELQPPSPSASGASIISHADHGNGSGLDSEPDLGPAFVDRGELLRLLDLDRLLPAAVRARLAGVCLV